MARRNKKPLAERIASAAESALSSEDYVSPIDVLGGIGWLTMDSFQRWRQGRAQYLEELMQVPSERLAEALRLLRSWATERGLGESEATYVSRTPERKTLRFSVSGDPALERAWRTHWLSAGLSDKKRERLEQKAQAEPELVVIQPLNPDWKCHRCGGSGGLLVMDGEGPACLRCVGLDDLELLPSGDALMTRRARSLSKRFAVVVRFSRSRKRYERQGLLVEPQALREAEHAVRRKGAVD